MTDDVLDQYAARIETFTSELLEPYLKKLSGLGPGQVNGKEFNDPVWGTITLNAAEVIVLDSPLLQRLRRIRQLGVAQYVYPGANHTRIEHSLGVCHQVQKLTDSVRLHGEEAGFGELPAQWVVTLRMAALCHDMGHGLMSHVIENALKHDRDVGDLIIAFQERLELDDESQLSEIAAYYMLRSEAMQKLLAEAFRIGSPTTIPDRMHENMANCVIGVSEDNTLPLIHEIISGPFDCDKLDYMTRDALMCGVPVVTDVTRLIQKVRAAEVRTDKLPPELSARVEDKGGTHLVVAVARSGASTLHEVSLGRSLMHDKIYRHHKVRAVEAMVSAIVEAAGTTLDPFAPMIPLAILDDEFLSLDMTRLQARSGAEDQSNRDGFAVAADLAQRIRDRVLFVRAFAFAQKMPFDAYRDDHRQRDAIEQLIRDSDRAADKEAIIDAIVGRVHEMLRALGESEVLETFPGQDIKPYIRIDPPRIDSSDASTDQSRAYLVDDQKNIVMLSQVSAETRGWADAYINTRDVGYVFAPKEISSFVHIATEIVLRVDRGIAVPREMHSYAKVESAAVQALRQRLFEVDFYSALPKDLGPVPEFLRSAGTEARIEAAAKMLGAYMGPSRGTSDKRAEAGVINATKIRDWLTQFPDQYIPHALATVESIKLLDRALINQSVRSFMEDAANDGFLGAPLVPIGGAKDGSALQTYFAGDVGREFGSEPLAFPDAILTGKPLVFVDDLIGRGSSIISVFEAWLGLPDTQHLVEERGEPLAPVLQEALRNIPIAIVTSAAREGGKETIEGALASYGLDVRVRPLLDDAQLPRLESTLKSSALKDVEGFTTYCREVGRELVADGRDPDGRALGYGNDALLVITSFNTPTMTLTLLWKEGLVGGTTWRPLVGRKPKL